MQQQFTQEELTSLEQYNKMAQAYHAFKGYQEQIRDIRAEMQTAQQSKDLVLSPEQKQSLQQQLDTVREAQQKFTDHCFNKETGVFKDVGSPLKLDARMQAMERAFYPRIEQEVHQPQPHPLIEQTYATMTAEQQRREDILRASQAQRSTSQLTDAQLVKVMQYYDRQQKDAEALLENVNFKKDEITQYVQAQLDDAKYALQDLAQKHAERLARIGPIDYSYRPPSTEQELRELARKVSREALDEKARVWRPYKLLTEREMLHMALNDELSRGLLDEKDYLKEVGVIKQQERREQQEKKTAGRTLEM